MYHKTTPITNCQLLRMAADATGLRIADIVKSERNDPTFPPRRDGRIDVAAIIAWRKSKEDAAAEKINPPQIAPHRPTYDRRGSVADRRRRAP